MKSVFLAIALCFSLPAQAALLAEIETTEGTIEVELLYNVAPQAVANFIKLSQGTQPRIDETTGNLTTAPLYIGEKFFRIVNTSTFKIAQTGSGTGTNSGGPGYTFKDEFDPAVRHDPYVLSMANSGPNTNGSQIFFTGDVSSPGLDDVHTVFGTITDPDSRTTVDEILAAGNDGSTITAITISRTDALAQAFDENAQGIPVLTQVEGRISAENVVSFTPTTAFQVGDLLAYHRSTDLITWSPAANNAAPFASIENAPLGSLPLPDPATGDFEFFRLTKITHPGSVSPASHALRTYFIDLGGQSLSYTFDATGEAGTFIFNDGNSDASGTFTTDDRFTYFSPHACGFAPIHTGVDIRFLWIRIGCDELGTNEIIGHHSTQGVSNGQFVPLASGTATISN